MEYTEKTAAHLAEDAASDWGHEAAVWLLTEHGHWLPELARTDLLTRMSPNRDSHWVRIDWARVGPAILLRHEGLIGTPSEWQVLCVACSLSGRHACGWADLSSLDDRNRRLVLHAVAWAAGGREYAESLGLLTPGRAICWRCHHFAAWHVAEIGEPGRACTGSVCGCDDLTTEP